MKIIPITCHKCSKIVTRPKKEIDRQIRNGRINFFCSLSCAQSYNKKTTSRIISKCLFCNKEFATTSHKKSKKCCSLDCAHKYAQSFVNTTKTSISMKKAWKRGDFDGSKIKRVLLPRIYNFNCIICNRTFTRITKKIIKDVKTCSHECFKELLSRQARQNPNCGGDTNYKKYKYNNIWMDSKWEVELATWLDTRTITWERNRKKHNFLWTDINGKKRRYYPDFYLPKYNVYLDPKNKYLINVDKFKISQVIKENGIILLWGLLEDVKKEIDTLPHM